MQIHFDKIPPDGLRLQVTDPAWFPDKELTRCGPVAASVFLERKGGKRVLMEGTIKAEIELACDRCLEPFRFTPNGAFQVEFELLETAVAVVSEHECSTDEMDTVFLDEPVIDLFQVLRQQIFLALPVKTVCCEDCQGLCSRCGSNLNQGACSCPPGTASSGFGVLQALKR